MSRLIEDVLVAIVQKLPLAQAELVPKELVVVGIKQIALELVLDFRGLNRGYGYQERMPLLVEEKKLRQCGAGNL